MYKQVQIAPMLELYAKDIAELRTKCASEISLNQEHNNDDLFLLRFCLSHPTDVEKRITSVKETCVWREKNKEALAKIRAGERHPATDLLARYAPSGMLDAPMQDGSPVFIVRTGRCNMTRLLEKVKPEEIRDGMIFQKEETQMILDRESRKRGCVVKMVAMNDFQDFGYSSFSRVFMANLGEAAKATEVFYPQLLGCGIMMHPPGFMRVMMSVAKLVMPASTLEKTKFCSGTLGDDISKCPVARKVFPDLRTLPTFLGGSCTSAYKGGCIAGIPNNFSGIVYGNERSRFAELTIVKVSVTITTKAKNYNFRVRVVMNSLPLAQLTNPEMHFIGVKAKERADNIPLVAADLGPYLIPYNSEGKPEKTPQEFKDTVVIILAIEKLDTVVGNDFEKKEKRLEVEITPFVAMGCKLDFGDTAELSAYFEPIRVVDANKSK